MSTYNAYELFRYNYISAHLPKYVVVNDGLISGNTLKNWEKRFDVII